MPRRRLGRIGLLLLGLLVGFSLTVGSLWLWVRHTQRMRVVEEGLSLQLGLPRQAFELQKIEPDGALAIVLRNVAFLDERGDTIVSAPRARATLVASSVNGEGPFLLRDAELIRPDLRLAQDRSGEWNVFRIVAVEADGTPVRGAAGGAGDAPPSKPIEIRGLRIVDGRVRIAYPLEGPPPAPAGRFAGLKQPEVRREGGRWVRVSYLNDVDAFLPYVRMGGGSGAWKVEVGEASADVQNPDTRIAGLRGTFESRGDEVVRFNLQELRTANSSLAGSGTIRTGGETLAYDVNLRVRQLDFRDLQGTGVPIPSEGTASFDVAIRTLSGGRTQFDVSNASVGILGSRLGGDVTVVVGPNGTQVLGGTKLTLNAVRLADLERLNYIDRTPFAGVVSGTVESERGGVRVDIAARITPRDDTDAPPSVFTATGLVRLPEGRTPLRLEGLRVQADPLRLATLRPLAPESADLLRGVLRGGATLNGTLASLRLTGGDLAYQVGDAPASRIRGLSGTVSLTDPLRYSIEGNAEPLALATLTELFPSLPFRSATLSGPIAVSGTREAVNFRFDLDGAAGGIAARGSLALGGEVPRFDISGRVDAFRASSVLRDAPAAAQQRLTGTFSARGTTQDLRFAVDLAQGGGSFALAGNVRRPGGGPAQYDVAGRVDNFRIGSLFGRPDLLPGPVTGPVAFSGGGRQPYRFDVALRGGLGLLDVRGWYQPGTVPSYAVSGSVAQLDVSALPGLAAAPRTRLTGTLSIQGRGTTPETFSGTVAFNAQPGSLIGRFPLQAGLARVTAADGILRVDTLNFALRGARFAATGAIGLTRPTAEPLRFSLNAPDLAALRPLIPGGDTLPDLAGALTARGAINGTVRDPVITAEGTGRGLRYGTLAAGTLAFNVADLRRGPASWIGQASLAGTALEFGGQRLASLRLETNLTPTRAAFSLAAQRDAGTDVAASGTLELDGLAPTGAIFDTFALRLGGTQWRLTERARLAWGGGGLAVENFALRRSDGGAGFIEADGTLPPSGIADLQVRVGDLNLADLRRLAPTATIPELGGALNLQAAITGPVAAPQLFLDARVDSLTLRGVRLDRLAVVGRYAAGRLELTGDAQLAGRRVLELRAGVPLTLSLAGTIPEFELLRDGPLTATLTSDSLPLAVVAAGVPTLENGEGVAQARVEVTGTLRRPRLSGGAQLSGGAFTVVPLGVRWRGIAGSVSLAGNLVRVDSLVARTGDEGVARVDGTLSLADMERPEVYLRLFMNDFQVIDRRDVAELQADAALAISGRLTQAVATGSVGIEDGTIFLPEFGGEAEGEILGTEIGEIGADTISAPVGAAAYLAALRPRDLRVRIGDAVWLQSPDARIQIQGELLVDQAPGTAAPAVYGDLQAVRGSYTLAVGPIEREFQIRSGLVRFFGTPELNPGLDILAEYEVPDPDLGGEDITVQVRLTGTVQNPQVALSANTRQPLPASDIASLLVFGRQTATAGTAVEALTSQVFGGVLVEEFLGNLFTRELEEQLIRTGFVDYIRVRARPTGQGFGAFTFSGSNNIFSSVSLEAGKELVDDVYLSFQVFNIFSDESGARRFGLALDWEITRTLSLRAAFEPVRRDPLLLQNVRGRTNQGSLDLRRRWEYGRPRRTDQTLTRPRRRDPAEPAPGVPSTPTGEPPPPPPPENTSTTPPAPPRP
jgi:autotransporter translocation and assembly factor TamB